MNQYTPNNPPKSGNARKIWKALESSPYGVKELHYNPNCWGADKGRGWGSWACMVNSGYEYFVVINERYIYLEEFSAPYRTILVKEFPQK